MGSRAPVRPGSGAGVTDGLDGLVDELAAELELPGVAVAVVRPGEEPTVVCRGRGVLTDVRAHVLFGGQLDVRRGPTGLEVRGRRGPLRSPRPLHPGEEPGTFRLALRGIELPVAFVEAPGGRVDTMRLDGSPTAFALHRRRWPGGRHLLIAALVLGAALARLRREVRTR